MRTDLGRSEDVRRLMETAGERFGRLDILINPAAILLDPATRVDQYSEESWRRVIDVNLTGSFLLLKYAVPLMEKAGGGVVLFVISGAGVIGGSSSLPYGSSKGGGSGGWSWSPASNFAPSTFASTPWPRGRWRRT